MFDKTLIKGLHFLLQVIGKDHNWRYKLKTVSYHLSDKSLVFKFISGRISGTYGRPGAKGEGVIGQVKAEW